jgi:hypothetical protein
VNTDGLWIAVGVVSSAIGTAGGIYGAIIHPERKERAKADAERLERRRAVDFWIDGGKQIDGSVVVGAPEKLHDVELATRAMASEVAGVSRGQAVLEKRMDEANGTSRRTEGIAAEALGISRRTESQVGEIHTMIQNIVIAGTDVKLALDKDARELAHVTEGSKVELLDAIGRHDQTHEG